MGRVAPSSEEIMSRGGECKSHNSKLPRNTKWREKFLCKKWLQTKETVACKGLVRCFRITDEVVRCVFIWGQKWLEAPHETFRRRKWGIMEVLTITACEQVG
jgi:hypothetical protein